MNVPVSGSALSQLEATFTGTFVVKTTNARARGPFTGPLTIGCSFSADRTLMTITRFPAISVGPIRVPVFGVDTVTATRTGGGSGSSTPGTGAMSMRIVLLFHHSLTIRFYPLDSTLSLLMDTGTHTSPRDALRAGGSPMDAQGMVTFAGVGVFSGGYLAGDEASIVLAGHIAPHPWERRPGEKPEPTSSYGQSDELLTTRAPTSRS